MIRRAFADGKTQDFVKAVPRILSTVAAIAVAKRENVEADERRQLAREEEARLRAEAERRAGLERRRAAALDVLMDGHRRLVGLEAYLAALEGPLADAGEAPRMARLAAWLRARLARMRSEATPAALEERLAGERLFEDGDD